MVEIRNRSYVRVLDSVVAEEKKIGSGGDGEDNEEDGF